MYLFQVKGGGKMEEKNQTRIAISVFGVIFVIILVGLYVGREKGEIKSGGVKREVKEVENTYRRDDFYKKESGDSPYEGRLRDTSGKEESTDGSYEEGTVLNRLANDVSESDQEELRHDFYGEKLVFAGPPEDAFKIVVEEGGLRVIHHEKAGEEKANSSIYSYALFDSLSPNRLSIDLYNMSHPPVEMDYYGDEYYLEDYAENIHQLKIDMKQGDYNRTINLQEGKTILVKYPSSIPEANIKNIIIKLKKSEIVVALQRLPDILY